MAPIWKVVSRKSPAFEKVKKRNNYPEWILSVLIPDALPALRSSLGSQRVGAIQSKKGDPSEKTR